MARLRNVQRKPISFDTTIRNPERLGKFLSILKKYENKILTYEIALEIEAWLIIYKIYEPTKDSLGTYTKEYSIKFKFIAEDQSKEAEKKVSLYFNEWKKSEPGKFPLDKMLYLLKNTIQKFKQDSSMPGGWVSRFYTQYLFSNELGFVHTEFGKKIQFSENGNMMIHNFTFGKVKENYNDVYEASAFLTAFSKYQSNNPYRSNTIKVNFFVLVLNVIKYLNEKYNKHGIHREDLTFIIAWGSNDYVELAEYIYRFRAKFRYTASEETIYDYAMNLIENEVNPELKPASKEFIAKKKTHYKHNKLINETRDEVIRKLRMTRLISLRGSGRFIDIDTLNKDKVDYILQTYSKNINFDASDYQAYLDYMGNVDKNLIYPIEVNESEENFDIKQKALKTWAAEPWDFLQKELVRSANGSNTDNLILREIKSTARFEFLISAVLYKALPKAIIQPNYIVDDEGIPYSTATGQTKYLTGADIDIFEDSIHALAEPTISKSRSFQVEHEIPSIQEHVLETNEKDFDDSNREHIDEWFALFIAPNINKAVGNRIDIVREESGVEIYAWNAKDFGEYIQNLESIRELKVIRNYAVGRKMKKRLKKN
ncbi:AlwI family type II restriction endonuclease [Mammaliicoccus sciuri]|uniref:AlwI family type II restriction endonuclease n=1 Tax=Mammaliicoccus sciuri TaxID=1296 RepID=UPI0027EC6A01|nr:AlwI family type II restriction endonuclease [Mammaliicoccus sciuri]MDQ7131234.1 AlwI family type II restriction endonuclease [Mammaliicoccus sciuri]